jgi:hypothetical protein
MSSHAAVVSPRLAHGLAPAAWRRARVAAPRACVNCMSKRAMTRTAPDLGTPPT